MDDRLCRGPQLRLLSGREVRESIWASRPKSGDARGALGPVSRTEPRTQSRARAVLQTAGVDAIALSYVGALHRISSRNPRVRKSEYLNTRSRMPENDFHVAALMLLPRQYAPPYMNTHTRTHTHTSNDILRNTARMVYTCQSMGYLAAIHESTRVPKQPIPHVRERLPINPTLMFILPRLRATPIPHHTQKHTRTHTSIDILRNTARMVYTCQSATWRGDGSCEADWAGHDFPRSRKV